MRLPTIELDQITTLPKALNAIEECMTLLQKQDETIQQLQAEVARMQGQPRKPQFPSSDIKQQSASVTGLLKEKTPWHKSSKKGTVAIDREEKLSEVDYDGNYISDTMLRYIFVWKNQLKDNIVLSLKGT